MRRIFRLLTILLAIAQLVASIGVFSRMARTAQGTRIVRAETAAEGKVSVLIPVLNEETRLAPCLTGAIAQGPAVAEIIVIDGGSLDGTREIVKRFAAEDERVRLIDAPPAPAGANGKAWQLEEGYQATGQTDWLLTLDADVRPDAVLAASLLAHANASREDVVSVATTQRLSGAAESIVHPAMLTSLVYRFGIPGHATSDPAQVQANGQCFLIRREVLEEVGGFAAVTASICEDVTLARAAAAHGNAVGFHESDDLVSVEMYSGWRDAWRNWSRSLPMRDAYATTTSDIGLLEVTLVQALPLLIAAVGRLAGESRHSLVRLNTMLLFVRGGVLAGTARAYHQRHWTYWLSPLADLPVALRLWQMSRRRTHTWRGRTLTGESTR